MPEPTRSFFRRKPALAAALPLLVFGAAGLLFGCLPDPDRNAGRPAPVVDIEQPDADTAFWRQQYKNNRMIPPEHFSVMPKPPRNNGFGEFDDELQFGLDVQPELPELPGDISAAGPVFGNPGTYAMAAPEYAAPVRAGSGYPATAAPAGVRTGVGTGVRTETAFHPIEQLVFGGDHADFDRPEHYRLMPGDVISVTVKDHPEFSGKVTVQPDGTVRIPNSPDLIRLRGLTVDEAAAAIRDVLTVYVRGECLVRVQANRARGGYYFVFGDVLQPGRFPMGLEPVRLSDAVMAANWEANPARLPDGDELGPAFPAASPKGKFQAPRSADLARVMLITPHRSQPVRTTHDIRQAMLGVTADDPAVRPGQIVVVPSLDPEKNLAIGLDVPNASVPPPALMPGQGFSGAGTTSRLPEVLPPAPAFEYVEPPVDAVEANLGQAFSVQSTAEPMRVDPFPEAEEACPTEEWCPPEDPADYHNFEPVEPPAVETVSPERYDTAPAPPPPVTRGRRLRRAPIPGPGVFGRGESARDEGNWAKGF